MRSTSTRRWAISLMVDTFFERFSISSTTASTTRSDAALQVHWARSHRPGAVVHRSSRRERSQSFNGTLTFSGQSFAEYFVGYPNLLKFFLVCARDSNNSDERYPPCLKRMLIAGTATIAEGTTRHYICLDSRRATPV